MKIEAPKVIATDTDREEEHPVGRRVASCIYDPFGVVSWVNFALFSTGNLYDLPKKKLISET